MVILQAQTTLNPPSRARITAIGSYIPEQRITNADMERMVDTSDEWIIQRTGIHERRKSAEHEYTSDLCIKAVQDLLDRSGKSPEDIDFIIVSTTTSEHVFPSAACLVQAAFHIPHCGAIDMNATCAGFTYGLHLANTMITSGMHRKILVIGAETLTKVTDYTDRTTCILFGDGAGAVLLEADDEKPGLLAFHYGSDGTGGKHVYRSNLAPTIAGSELQFDGRIHQNGREVYKWAVTTVPEGIRTLVDKANMSVHDVNWIIPHSANLRILEAICERLDYPVSQVQYSLDMFGNTSSASIPLALDKGIKNGEVKPGDHLILYGFGGGLVHCGILLKWDPDMPQ